MANNSTTLQPNLSKNINNHCIALLYYKVNPEYNRICVVSQNLADTTKQSIDETPIMHFANNVTKLLHTGIYFNDLPKVKARERADLAR